MVEQGSLTLTTRVGCTTLPRASRGPITDSTAPTPPPVQNGRDPPTCSSSPTSLLREHTRVSRLGLNPAAAGVAPAASLAGSAGVSTTLSGPRLLAPLPVGSYPSPAADGRLWKYWANGRPAASVNDWPISRLPTGLPLARTIEPSALSCKPGSCATNQISNGYPAPRMTVKTTSARKAAQCWRTRLENFMSGHPG